jgi:RNA polymerase sigma-70 factor (ECF subfamily)
MGNTAPVVEDLELLQGYVARGRMETIQVLLQKHQRMVFATCLRRLKRHCDAEDATQEVFLRLMENAGNIRTNVGAWLRRCALNTANSMVRSRQRRAHHETEKARLARMAWCDGDEVLARERVAILRSYLRELSDIDRNLLIQNCVMGGTQKEIASRMGITQQAVAKRIGKAMVRIRRGLSSQGIVLSIAGAVVLLARKASSAIIPRSLSLPSLPSTSLVSTGAGTGGTAAVVKAGVAAVLLLAVAVVTYKQTPSQSLTASAPKAQSANLASDQRPWAQGKAAGSSIGHRSLALPALPVNGSSAGARSTAQKNCLPASADFQASASPAPDRQFELASSRQPTQAWQNRLAGKKAISTQLEHDQTLLAKPSGPLASRSKDAKAPNFPTYANASAANVSITSGVFFGQPQSETMMAVVGEASNDYCPTILPPGKFPNFVIYDTPPFAIATTGFGIPQPPFSYGPVFLSDGGPVGGYGIGAGEHLSARGFDESGSANPKNFMGSISMIDPLVADPDGMISIVGTTSVWTKALPREGMLESCYRAAIPGSETFGAATFAATGFFTAPLNNPIVASPQSPGAELFLAEPNIDPNAAGSFEVTPEPTSLILLVAGGLATLRPRRRA